MDETESIRGPQVNDGNDAATEGRSAQEIRAEIEQTREELGDTAAALAEKTDVKGQAKRAAHNAKDTVTEKLADAKDTVGAKAQGAGATAREATPESAAQAGEQASKLARENRVPLMIAGAFVLGLLIGRRR